MEQNLVDWAKPYLGDKRKVFRIMDTKLAGQYPQKAAYTASTLALQCLCAEPRLRPRIIDVLEMLEQVQAPKTASKNSISDHQTVSDSKRKSPSGSHRSSTDRKPTASSLPPHQQSSGWADICPGFRFYFIFFPFWLLFFCNLFTRNVIRVLFRRNLHHACKTCNYRLYSFTICRR